MGASHFAPKLLFIISKDTPMTLEEIKAAKAAEAKAKAEAKAAAKASGMKVLVGKASLLIGKKRIVKGDRISAEEVAALPDDLKVLFADEARKVATLQAEKDDPQDGE
jgi:hypothetical protein